MLAIRSINNNTVVCKDSIGQEIIAMGKGIGFGKLPREILWTIISIINWQNCPEM